MWETYGLTGEELLWSGTAFTGGIGGQQQAPCGAISAAAICLGLRHYQTADKERLKQARFEGRQRAGELVKTFSAKFGSIACFDLVGIDFSKPGGYQQFQESGISKEKCDRYVQFVIETLFRLDSVIGPAKSPAQVIIYTIPGCPFCSAAKKDLEDRGVPYQELSTEGHPEIAQEVMRLSGGTGIVPIIVAGGEVTVGFGGG